MLTLSPFVMAGLVPAIHVLLRDKTRMPGARPGMTSPEEQFSKMS